MKKKKKKTIFDIACIEVCCLNVMGIKEYYMSDKDLLQGQECRLLCNTFLKTINHFGTQWGQLF